MPTIYGENVYYAYLIAIIFCFQEALGFTDDNLRHFDRFLGLKRGIILITGPTGSGKSTTLYTMLNEINNETDNIITVEDPVECKIPGINQIQINSKAGMTFANSLRSVLRQDPDVIMIGEIRDNETAQIAIRAAITGHLVLSTIHTHDAIGAIRRLLDMGIENYLLSDAPWVSYRNASLERLVPTAVRLILQAGNSWVRLVLLSRKGINTTEKLVALGVVLPVIKEGPQSTRS